MNPITRLEIYAVIAVVLAAAVGGAYWYAYHQGVLHERGEWEKKAAAATKADLDGLKEAVANANQIAIGTQTLLNKGRATKTIEKGIVERELKTNTIYLNDCLAPTGGSMWNSLNAGRPIMPDSPAGSGIDAPVSSGNGPAGTGLQRRDVAIKPPSRTGSVR